MGRLMNQIKRDLYKRKEGLIVGAIIGFAVSNFWLVNNPAIMQSALGTQSMMDNLLVSSGVVEVAKQKIVILMTLTFALIGYVIDGWMDKR